jgi:hypothetical protein
MVRITMTPTETFSLFQFAIHLGFSQPPVRDTPHGNKIHVKIHREMPPLWLRANNGAILPTPSSNKLKATRKRLHDNRALYAEFFRKSSCATRPGYSGNTASKVARCM